MRYKLFAATIVALAITSCSTKKNVIKQEETLSKNTSTASNTAKVKDAAPSKQKSIAFLQKVYDQKLYQKNFVSDLTFTFNYGDKNISVPGMLRMRKDVVIRLQLLMPLLRSEVGRIEFTPDYILFINRMHKQYVKATYSEVGFLRDNGINFYSLQALFWNEFFIPGQQGINEAGLQLLDVKTTALQAGQSTIPVVLKDRNLTYTWLVSNIANRISKTQASYDTSTLTWDYSSFAAFGSKQFPASQEITINAQGNSSQRIITAKMKLEDFNDRSDWDAITIAPSSYTKVELEEILRKLTSL